MKKLSLIIASIFGFIIWAKCQSSDTISAKVLWVNNLKSVNLIGIMPDINSADTIIVVSEVEKCKRKKGKFLKVGGNYKWVIQKAFWIASGPPRWSVKYGDVEWTNKESFNKQPRLCLNCNGMYIRSIKLR